MLRASSYNIYVDLPNNSEEMLFVHGYSGAYDKVSRRVATYVRSLETKRPPKPLYREWKPEPPVEGETLLPLQETIDVLKRRGYLTELTEEEEETYFYHLVSKHHDMEHRGSPGYVFLITYDCNLRCDYCFQDHMRTNPDFVDLLQTMQPATVDLIFEAMRQIEALHRVEEQEQQRRHITFYGGEPLLAQARPIVEYIINTALAAGEAYFTAITNGTDLDAYRDLLGPERISFLQITLDGPPGEHDKRRIYASGDGSFERIAQNVTMALDLGVSVTVRVNTDRDNIELVPQLADQIVERGWDRCQSFSAYCAPTTPPDDKTNEGGFLTSWQLYRELAKLRERHRNLCVIDGPRDSLRNTIARIFADEADPFPGFKSSYCSAHKLMYIFDPLCDIYACWEYTGNRDIRVGHIAADGRVFLNQLCESWRSRTVASSRACRWCPYAFYCGGGCAAQAHKHSGSFFANDCDGFQARFRASVAEAYLNHISGADRIVKGGEQCNR